MEACGGHVLRCLNKNNRIMGLHTPMWCRPSVLKTRQSNLTQNCDANTMFLAKTSSVASTWLLARRLECLLYLKTWCPRHRFKSKWPTECSVHLDVSTVLTLIGILCLHETPGRLRGVENVTGALNRRSGAEETGANFTLGWTVPLRMTFPSLMRCRSASCAALRA